MAIKFAFSECNINKSRLLFPTNFLCRCSSKQTANGGGLGAVGALLGALGVRQQELAHNELAQVRGLPGWNASEP